MTRSNLATGAILLVLAATMTYWMWYGLTQRSIIEDEGISILAGQGIVQHGYPLLPSGTIYHRGHAPNYLLAGSMLVFGTNDFSIMLPNLLLALGSLFLAYRLASDVFGRPWVGVISAAATAIVPLQTFYATGPRMYMTLQFFTMLATYAAWRGFVQGHAGYRWLTVLAIVGAELSHQQAGALLVAIPVAIVLVRWMQGASRPKLNIAFAVLALVVVWGAFFFHTVYEPETKTRPVSVHAGKDPGHAGLNLPGRSWLRHLDQLDMIVPFGLGLVPVFALIAIRSLRRREGPIDHAWVFMTMVFLLLTLALLGNVNVARSRFWVFNFPLYILLLCAGVATFIDWLDSPGAGERWRGITRRRLACIGLAGSIALVVVGEAAMFGPEEPMRRVARAIANPCASGECAKGISEQYDELRRQMEPGDVVVSTNPWVTHYYLEHVDGFLRERALDDGFGAFEHESDEYFGIRLIDTIEELEELSLSPLRTWIVTDHKLFEYSSDATQAFLEANFRKALANENLTVFVNAPGRDIGA